jgi:thymidylate synthase (FAD)
MGDDSSVVQAARVSYGQATKGEEADKKLINYMMKHNHGTPFEHIVYTFHIKCPIFVARQWFRHRIGSFNEISGRYVELDTKFWIPTVWRSNNQENKQSSGEAGFSPVEAERLYRKYHSALDLSALIYEELLEAGVAREQARAILPIGTYTEFYWTVNARSLFNFLSLRTAPDAQEEMRDWALAVEQIVEPSAPHTFNAYNALEASK